MAPTEFATAIGYALAGALVAGAASLVPALHVYNLTGLLVFAAAARPALSGNPIAYAFVGMAAGYAVLSTVPSVLLAVPDEASVFVVLPGQKYARQGRGCEAAVLVGTGSLAGIFLVALLAAVAHQALGAARELIQPHLHWILWTVIAWLQLSEWPKGADRAMGSWRRLWQAWRSLLAGLVTFGLSGVLGMVLFYRSPLPVEASFQGLLPAFVGLFAIPWLVLNITSDVALPRQHQGESVDVTLLSLARGAMTGLLGGLFAAFFPAVTGGIGGLIAGHATAQRDDRVFLASQGASKAAYYVGALLMLFVPGADLTRGGMAAMLDTIWSGQSYARLYAAIAAAIAAGTAAWLLLLPAARSISRLVTRVSLRASSLLSLGICLAVVWLTVGWKGMLVCATASGVGLIPALWGSRRVNCMGVILLPLALELSGIGGDIARWAGLL